MKKLIIWGVLLTLVPILVMAQGSIYKLGSTIRINPEDSAAKNVIAAGQFVDVMGHLNDDLFSAAENLLINGSVSDDAIVAGRTITMRGSIGDMLMAAGETIIIDGEVFGDLFAAGNEVRLAPNAKIHGNAALAGNEVIFEGGSIDGWLRVAGNEITLDGRVNNYVELYGNTFSFGDNYQPASKTYLTSTRKITREELGNAPDDLTINIEEKETNWGGALLFSIWFYVAMLLVGFLVMVLFRETTADLYRFSTERYLRNTGIGLLLFIGIPIAIIVLLILVFTIPLSIILGMLYLLTLTFGFLLVALTLGTACIRYVKGEEAFSDFFWGLALGIILILLITAIPVVGGFLNLLLVFFGLGTLLSYFWTMRTNTI